MADPALPQLVEDLFRHRYGRMVASLVRALGAERLELAEDVVQEAMLRALRTWPAEWHLPGWLRPWMGRGVNGR